MRIRKTDRCVHIGDTVVTGEVADQISKFFERFDDINLQWNVDRVMHVSLDIMGTRVTFYGGFGFDALDYFGVVKKADWPWLNEVAKGSK